MFVGHCEGGQGIVGECEDSGCDVGVLKGEKEERFCHWKTSSVISIFFFPFFCWEKREYQKDSHEVSLPIYI